MSGYNPQVAKERIKQLREVKKWTQSQMAKKLDQYIGYNGKGIYFTKIVLEGETGRQTINQLEGKGKRKITIPIAIAYADIFNVSIDYILGRVDNYEPEYKSINEQIGISDEAIKALQNMNKKMFISKQTVLPHKTNQDKSTDKFQIPTIYTVARSEAETKFIYRLISMVLCDNAFWDSFSSRIRNICNYLLYSTYENLNYNNDAKYTKESEIYNIVKDFERLLEKVIVELDHTLSDHELDAKSKDIKNLEVYHITKAFEALVTKTLIELDSTMVKPKKLF